MTMPTDLEIIAPYQGNLIKGAEQYCTLMHLPTEAMSSIIYTFDSWQKLASIIARQQMLPPEKRRDLVDTGKTALAPQAVEAVDEYVRMHLIPYNYMTWLEGRPYPKAEGLRYKLRADMRILKQTKSTRIYEKIGGEETVIGYHTEMDFWNGEHYESDGWADYAELATRRQKTKPSVGFICMIAETRSVRRCTLKALGLPSGVAEEVQDGVEYAQTEQHVAIKVTPNNASRAAFISRCQIELMMNPEEVAKALEPTKVKLDEITDFTKAFDYLMELKEKESK
jgi:hypothetical protein